MTRGATARLFVALDLPDELRARLAAWARCAAAGVRSPSTGAADAARALRARRPPARALRLLDADTLHLTLRFLGSRPVGEIEAIGEALAAACAQAPPVGELALGAPLWLPPRRPRALAVEIHDDPRRALAALHDALAAALALVCDSPSERRRFRAHVTVARMSAREAPRERRLPATPALCFAPQSVALYRSTLTPAEAVYEELARHALARGG
jgi:2'-5' RNA ligase